MVSLSLSPLLRFLPRLPIAIAVLAFAACSSTEQATSEIATLEADTSAVGDAAGAITPDDVDGELSADEAALEFSQCMRDEGLDFPDLSVDADGNIELRAAFQSVNPGDEGFREAMDGCREILEQTGFGGGGRGQALESPEIQDALLDFSQCVRDAGYDVGDLTLQGPGAGGGGQGAGGNAGAADANTDADTDADAGEGGRGQRQQGFGNPSARFATGLGLDYEDPDVQETIDGCAPIVDEAFAAAGIGQGRG
ncbi:MAG: hypothetical protein ACRBK7_18755 [Acidimicrobiales bacterium]